MMKYEYAIKVLLEEMNITDVPVMFRQPAEDLIKYDMKGVVEYARTKKWEEMKEIRDTKQSSGLPYKGSVLDYDLLSAFKLTQARDGLNNAVEQGLITKEQAFIDWTMQDNSVMVLAINDLEEIPFLAVQYSNSLHQKGREIRNRIYSSSDVAEIMGVKWE